MEQDQQPRPRFDQEAALEELERFGRDIQEYRARRQAVGDQFESFVQSLKTPPEAPARADRTAASRSEPAPPAEAAPRSDAVASAVAAINAAGDATRVFETPSTELSPPAIAATPETLAVTAPGPREKTPIAAIAAGAALVVGGGLLAAFLWNRGPGPAPAPADTTDAPAAAAAAPTPAATSEPAPPAAATTASTAPVNPNDSEIATERRVWLRVTVDGARVVERELPAGAKLTLKAEKTIVIRTGDAGAVRLSIRGGPGALLGREGEVVTRSFTVPPRSEGAR